MVVETPYILLPYRPDPERQRSVPTDLCRRLNEEAARIGGRKFSYHTWWNRETGEWVVSRALPTGEWIDVAFAGSSERPSLSPGQFQTVIRMTIMDLDRKSAIEEVENTKRRRIRELYELQVQEMERRRWYRRKLGPHFSDHPVLRDSPLGDFHV